MSRDTISKTVQFVRLGFNDVSLDGPPGKVMVGLMGVEQKIVTSDSQPVRLEVSRSARGGYYWTITVKAESVEEAVKMQNQADVRLRVMYPEGVKTE